MKKLALAGLIYCYNQFVESPSRRAAHHGNQEVLKQGWSSLTQSYLLYCLWSVQKICFHFHIVSQRPVNTQMSLDKRQTSKAGCLAEDEQQQNSYSSAHLKRFEGHLGIELPKGLLETLHLERFPFQGFGQDWWMQLAVSGTMMIASSRLTQGSVPLMIVFELEASWHWGFPHPRNNIWDSGLECF